MIKHIFVSCRASTKVTYGGNGIFYWVGSPYADGLVRDQLLLMKAKVDCLCPP